jgi:hypothetical protein
MVFCEYLYHYIESFQLVLDEEILDGSHVYSEDFVLRY